MEEKTRNIYELTIYDVIEPEILVVCPKCNHKATIKTGKFSSMVYSEGQIKLVCGSCGYNKKFSETSPSLSSTTTDINSATGRGIAVGIAKDPFFHLDLWLSKSCSDHVLWAYNKFHLSIIQAHISAPLRNRNLNFSNNRSLGSRLPKWMTSRKNREAVMKALKDLEEKGG